ncbi:tRNA (adenosine(37)-N6)-threonylcarbamoyltransferase complex ATPase subunit type 1 TsaE [Algibacillus agarilyticus]|uniref:tRNA (adenosine(37)-N6)-threonylcarbamoyltransferase complex ATPase subunit type 1 TsaE n=1 Tax=Algibacillus agarilyticus TaxID=2234133 RepID=UPI000DD0CE45|nr:tRNA (adenosine(37)-N6)-threonylcarbamoyltransferase complex ATPase subunit type 1 TsaE [Algibacillus agarilyticus]
MTTYSFELTDAEATVAFGKRLSSIIKLPCQIHLVGDLGAGKTTFSRGLIQGFGYSGNVKSPTYTLVEPYELGSINIYHFDLYRLADPEELEFMGIRDYFAGLNLCVIEWPEKGDGWLEPADILVNMQYIEQHRRITLTAKSEHGRKILTHLTP